MIDKRLDRSMIDWQLIAPLIDDWSIEWSID